MAGISWEDVSAYCQRFSKTHGVAVRLPFEAESEYAARFDDPYVTDCGSGAATLASAAERTRVRVE